MPQWGTGQWGSGQWGQGEPFCTGIGDSDGSGVGVLRYVYGVCSGTGDSDGSGLLTEVLMPAPAGLRLSSWLRPAL